MAGRHRLSHSVPIDHEVFRRLKNVVAAVEALSLQVGCEAAGRTTRQVWVHVHGRAWHGDRHAVPALLPAPPAVGGLWGPPPSGARHLGRPEGTSCCSSALTQLSPWCTPPVQEESEEDWEAAASQVAHAIQRLSELAEAEASRQGR